MTDRSKKAFLMITILGSFLVYSLIYYGQVFSHAPYNFSEFKSFVFKYGTRDITTFDTLMLLAALAGILIWWTLNDALLAIIVATAVDMIGYVYNRRGHFHASPEQVSNILSRVVVQRPAG